MVRKFMVFAAAASLAIGSIAASAAEVDRAPSSLTKAESLSGEGDAAFYVLALLVAVAAIVIIASNDGDDEPASP